MKFAMPGDAWCSGHRPSFLEVSHSWHSLSTMGRWLRERWDNFVDTVRRTLAAATWRALHKALFPHQRTDLRKGKIPQRLSHLEWFGVAIQLPGSQSLSELLGLKTDQSKRPLRKTKSTHKQQTDQNGRQTRPTGQQTHTHTCSEISYRITDMECIVRAKTLQLNLTGSSEWLGARSSEEEFFLRPC